MPGGRTRGTSTPSVTADTTRSRDRSSPLCWSRSSSGPRWRCRRRASRPRLVVVAFGRVREWLGRRAGVSGCEPAALATESLPGCPPGPIASRAVCVVAQAGGGGGPAARATDSPPVCPPGPIASRAVCVVARAVVEGVADPPLERSDRLLAGVAARRAVASGHATEREALGLYLSAEQIQLRTAQCGIRPSVVR